MAVVVAEALLQDEQVLDRDVRQRDRVLGLARQVLVVDEDAGALGRVDVVDDVVLLETVPAVKNEHAALHAEDEGVDLAQQLDVVEREEPPLHHIAPRRRVVRRRHRGQHDRVPEVVLVEHVWRDAVHEEGLRPCHVELVALLLGHHLLEVALEPGLAHVLGARRNLRPIVEVKVHDRAVAEPKRALNARALAVRRPRLDRLGHIALAIGELFVHERRLRALLDVVIVTDDVPGHARRVGRARRVRVPAPERAEKGVLLLVGARVRADAVPPPRALALARDHPVGARAAAKARHHR